MNALSIIILCSSLCLITHIFTTIYINYKRNTRTSAKFIIRRLIYTAGDYFLKGHSYDLALLLIEASEHIMDPKMIIHTMDNLDYLEMKARIKRNLESNNPRGKKH